MKIRYLYFLLLIQLLTVDFIFGQDILFDKKISVYKKDGGNKVMNLPVIITHDLVQNDYILCLGDQGKFIDMNGEQISVWIFSKEISPNDLKKNKTNIYCDKDLSFKIFSKNDLIDFNFSDEKRIISGECFSFQIKETNKEKIDLRLQLYVGITEKKKEKIEEASPIYISFEKPITNNTVQKKKSIEDKKLDVGIIDISIDTMEYKNIENEDSLKLIEKKENLHEFILKANSEIIKLLEYVDKTNPEDMSDLWKDSINIIAVTNMKKVNNRRTNPDNINLLESDEILEDHFIQFDFTYEQINKKLSSINTEDADFDEPINWLLIAGIGFAVIMIAMPLWAQVKSKKELNKQKKLQKQMEEKQKLEELLSDNNDIPSI